jgi:hypothetical protein
MSQSFVSRISVEKLLKISNCFVPTALQVSRVIFLIVLVNDAVSCYGYVSSVVYERSVSV